MFSAAEAAPGLLFINCREAIPTRHTLKIMGHNQPPNPMQINRTTTLGLATNNIASKHLTSMGMQLHWFCCRITQRQFHHYWQSGPTNLGDYVTKHHASIHHRAVRGIYLAPKSKFDLLRRRALTATAA